MIEIPLTFGKTTIISDKSWDLVSQYKWYASFEGGSWKAKASVGKHHKIYMHRLIMGAKEGDEIDHVNRNSLDNQMENLRFVTEPWQQGANKEKVHLGASSVYKGVCWDKSRDRWVAYIDKNRKRKYLGRFSEEVQAAIAYNRAAIELFGEFAVLNEVSDVEPPSAQ